MATDMEKEAINSIYTVTCPVCGEVDEVFLNSKDEAIEHFITDGWKFSKKDEGFLCPDCVNDD